MVKIKDFLAKLHGSSIFRKLFVTMTIMAALIVLIVGLYYTLFSGSHPSGLPGALHRKFLIAMIVMILFLVLGAHLLIRSTLRPIQWLRRGVDEIAAGNLALEIPVRAQDELGALTVAFNAMIRRIRETLKAQEQLLLNVSHELRSPITRMKLALEFIPAGDKKQQIAADLAEMESLIAEILEMERLRNSHGQLDIKPENLSRLVRDVVRTYQELPPGVIISNLPDDITVAIDAGRIRTVLQNLLENAIKYSLADSRAIEVFMEDHGETVALVVQDNGPGIPAEEMKNVFEPFYRLDRSRSKKTGGYGLGLSICQKIVAAHDGQIALQPGPDRGLIARVTLAKTPPKAD
jgi:signal transduction histidine kinase